MNIILVHNYYQQIGGEDKVLAREKALLLKYGHNVVLTDITNMHIKNLWTKLKTALNVVYSKSSRQLLTEKIYEFRPDVVHVHNFFPILTPSIYDACLESDIPVVQTLHNYRILCPGALFIRNGRICERCITGLPFRAIIHGCYRNSRIASLAVTRMVFSHRKRGTWQNKVDCFIAASKFAKKKFVEGGLPADKIIVKPNFVHPDPGSKTMVMLGKYALFVGRLSQEKGLITLLRAWRTLKGIAIKIVGDGPLRAEVESFVKKYGLKDVEILGFHPYEEVLALMKGARFLVFPSEWYETFGLVAIEAFACGIPVITSRLGVMAELIENGRTGLHFTPGDPVDLAEKVNWAINHPKELAQMRLEARQEYLSKYTAELNYKMLMDIYETAIERSRKKSVIQNIDE